MKIIYKRLFLTLTLFSFLSLLLLSFVYDNKYTIKMPFGQDGLLLLDEQDLQMDNPIHLIDGWQRYDGTLLPTELNANDYRITYIGEFSHFGQGQNSPHGEVTYRLKIEYSGEDLLAELHFPYLYTDYRLWWNGVLLESGKNVANANVILTQGTNEIVLNVTAKHGYYSGMYFPGSISRGNTLDSTQNIQTMLYAVAFLCPLTLAFFTLFLWSKTKDRVKIQFAFLCLSYSLYVSHYFVQLSGLNIGEWWYLVQDFALYSIVYFAMGTTMLADLRMSLSVKKYTAVIVLGIPAVELLLFYLHFPGG